VCVNPYVSMDRKSVGTGTRPCEPAHSSCKRLYNSNLLKRKIRAVNKVSNWIGTCEDWTVLLSSVLSDGSRRFVLPTLRARAVVLPRARELVAHAHPDQDCCAETGIAQGLKLRPRRRVGCACAMFDVDSPYRDMML
jgi:hypothetical protein